MIFENVIGKLTFKRTFAKLRALARGETNIRRFSAASRPLTSFAFALFAAIVVQAIFKNRDTTLIVGYATLTIVSIIFGARFAIRAFYISSLSFFAAALGSGVALLIGLDLISVSLKSAFKIDSLSPHRYLPMEIFSCVLAPYAETYVSNIWLQTSLVRVFRHKSLLIGTFSFALLHGTPNLYVLICGCLFAFVRYRYKMLSLIVILHALANLLLIILST